MLTLAHGGACETAYGPNERVCGVQWQPVRARQLGILPERHTPGRWNSITDVAGVLVGQTTLIEGPDVRTGVTAVVPVGLAKRHMLPAGLFVGNGYGKFVGATQVVELGVIETPIVLTGTCGCQKVDRGC